MEVQKIQTSSKRCKFRSATSNSVMKTSTDFSDQVDWTDGHWRNDSSLDKRIADQFRSKVYIFSDSVLCLNGNVPMILKQQELGTNDRMKYFVESPSQENPWNSYRRTHGNRMEDLRGENENRDSRMH